MSYEWRAMAPFLNYQSNAAESPIMRKWFLFALILSLIFHGSLYIWFKTTELPHFYTATDRLVPRAFQVNRLTINEKLLDESEESAPLPAVNIPAKKVKELLVPVEKPQFEKLMTQIRATPDSVEPSKTIVTEKPRVDSSTVQTVNKLQEKTAKQMEHEMDVFKDQILNDKPAVASGPSLNPNPSIAQKRPMENTDTAALAAASGRLDLMLGTGIQNSDAPLQLPGGALFDFDKADINPVSIQLLEKVAILVQKNPKVTFEIEGYTDSFGAPEHNLQLSTQRAESVKAGIVRILTEKRIQIDPSHIQARGFGGSHYKVEPKPVTAGGQPAIDAEIARQQPNRRVEIVFHFPAAQ